MAYKPATWVFSDAVAGTALTSSSSNVIHMIEDHKQAESQKKKAKKMEEKPKRKQLNTNEKAMLAFRLALFHKSEKKKKDTGNAE